MDNLQYILDNFKLHPDGSITRTDRKGGCGSLDKYGYLILKIKGRQYKAHRVAFALHNGRWPAGVIDHINGNRSDNRIENLREVSQAQNVANTKKQKNPDTGEFGIHIDRATKGLKKRFTFRFGGRSYRFYTIAEAKQMKDKLWEDKYGSSCETFQHSARPEST